jgi:hypothetical protein
MFTNINVFLHASPEAQLCMLAYIFSGKELEITYEKKANGGFVTPGFRFKFEISQIRVS